MSLRWWMPPAIGVGAVALANVCLFAAVARVHPEKVEAHPYAASAHEDAHLAALHAFASRGWRLVASMDAEGAVLRIEGGPVPGMVAVAVRLYRPDDAGLDRSVPWPDISVPLRVPLPRAGAWQADLAMRDGAGTAFAARAPLIRP